MSKDCCSPTPSPETITPTDERMWRLVLWFAFIINAIMFVAEFMSGVTAKSSALQADSLDFFSDAVNYGLSLGVASMALVWRNRIALFKGITLGVFGVVIILNTVWQTYTGDVPIAPIMGTVALLALLSNAVVALMLFRFRKGDANMRSVWICTRNDVIGNIAVLLAAMGVLSTGTGYPDYAVAFIMATLALSGSWQIMRHALAERKEMQTAAPTA
ncbi:MAG TPA: cation transporter [Candidatus Paceibacterota bacterium]